MAHLLLGRLVLTVILFAIGAGGVRELAIVSVLTHVREEYLLCVLNSLSLLVLASNVLCLLKR